MNLFWQTDRGLVKAIIIILIALLILAYFGLNIRSIVDSPTFADNWNFLKDLIVDVWTDYLKKPVTYLWNIFWNFIWTPTIENLESGGANPDTIMATSGVQYLPTPPAVR